MFTSQSVQEHINYDKIYQYFWIKYETQSPSTVLILDTEILISKMPISWYFIKQRVKKKMRKYVTKDNIKETGLNQVRRSGVVRWISTIFYNLDLNYPPQKLKISGYIQIVYFDEKGFENFMNSYLEYCKDILKQQMIRIAQIQLIKIIINLVEYISYTLYKKSNQEKLFGQSEQIQKMIKHLDHLDKQGIFYFKVDKQAIYQFLFLWQSKI